MNNAVAIVATKRPGGGKRYDIHVNGQLVEGGFFSRVAAEDAAVNHRREASLARLGWVKLTPEQTTRFHINTHEALGVAIDVVGSAQYEARTEADNTEWLRRTWD